jgi:hypothetical protein
MKFFFIICRLCEWRGAIHAFIPKREIHCGTSEDLHWRDCPGFGTLAQGMYTVLLILFLPLGSA